MLQSFMFVAVVIFLTSCVSSKPQQNSFAPEYKQCPELRPQMCTREYMPVCATRDTGVRCITAPCPSSEQRTYSNGCEACADAKVLGYSPNACAQKKQER
jgi:hypothetical protein